MGSRKLPFISSRVMIAVLHGAQCNHCGYKGAKRSTFGVGGGDWHKSATEQLWLDLSLLLV